MAKKSRRARAKQRTGESTGQRANIRQELPKSQGSRVTQSQPIGIATTVIKANQYDYVVGDLIRIGIISGALILVLIVLTFILR